MPTHFKLRRAFVLKRLLPTGVLFVLCYVVLRMNGVLYKPTSSMMLENILKQSPGRESLFISPFSRFIPRSKLSKLLAQHESVDKWANMTLSEQCHFYFATTYKDSTKWTNDHIRVFYNDDDLDNAILSMAVERMRVFDKCFIKGGLSLESVLGDIDMADFQHRMFPFLRNFSNFGELWPEILHLNTGEHIPRFSNPANLEKDSKFAYTNSQSFWQNWARFSSGRGLVMTLGERHKDIFLRLLRVLDHNGNRLPIQIIQKGPELSNEFIDSVSNFLKSSQQQVYIVDCSSLLNPAYLEEALTYFVNKWLAVVFNTFEEVITLDADVVPFVPLESFFENHNYKESGSLMYKDRNMLNEHTFDYCIDMFNSLEPSREASVLMGHSMIINATSVVPSSRTFQNEQEKVYYRFFYDKILHNVDSGLVVLNKKKKLSSLVLSFILNLDAKVKRCVYGDKEIFWLGQLIAGESYSIEPRDGGALGPITPLSLEDEGVKGYAICSTQIAHGDENNTLLWTNGGLKTCKIAEAAALDYQRLPEYFGAKYDSEDQLQEAYSQPLKMDGLITPDIFVKPWIRKDECQGSMYCAPLVESNADAAREGDSFVRFDQELSKQLNEISGVWNQES